MICKTLGFDIIGSVPDRCSALTQTFVQAQLCLKSRKSFLDRVSTGSGSDLVSDQRAIFLTFLTPLVDQVATAPCTDPIQVRLLIFEAKPSSSVFCNHAKVEPVAQIVRAQQKP